MRKRAAPVWLAASLLCACEVGPNYRPPQPTAPLAFAEAAGLPQAQSSAVPSDLSAWWTRLNDPMLNDLIRQGLAQSPDIDAARSRVRQARYETQVAAAALWPHLNAAANAAALRGNHSTSGAAAGGSATNSGFAGLSIPNDVNLYSAGFDATWEVDLFGGTRRGIEAANATREAQLWDLRDAQVSLVSEIANDYLTLRTLQARIAIGQAELARQRSLYRLIQARRATGFVTALDVNQQSGQVETAAAQIPQLEAQAKSQIHALGVLVGAPPETLIVQLSQAQPMPPPPPDLPIGLPSDLLQRRPDIRAAERRLAAANAQVGVQVANFFPKLNLIGLGSFAAPSVGQLFDTSNFAELGVGMLSQTVFDAGKTAANIRAAKEARRQAWDAYKETTLGAFQNVEDALVRYAAEAARQAHLAASVRSEQNSLQIAQAQYQVGMVTFINVLQAENSLLNARDQLNQSRGQSLTDLVALYKALGGGWS